ncbi:hypothetical protein LCGC14_1752990 [marine sediment metagenome]|uniref:Uncharacterized protein n=1 Tax=marine sediment metagenome TaxID=412755 RepID=A0A0F9HQN4_9ZZZZ
MKIIKRNIAVDVIYQEVGCCPKCKSGRMSSKLADFHFLLKKMKWGKGRYWYYCYCHDCYYGWLERGAER